MKQPDKDDPTTLLCKAAPEDAHCRRTAASGRRQPLTGGSRKNTGEFRNRSPMTRTRSKERTHPAAFQGGVPIGAPTKCSRNRTRPQRDSCAPASSQHASEDDLSASNDVPAVLGDHRGRGRSRYTRRIRAGVAGFQACRHGWAQPWSMQELGHRCRAGALSCAGLYCLSKLGRGPQHQPQTPPSRRWAVAGWRSFDGCALHHTLGTASLY